MTSSDRGTGPVQSSPVIVLLAWLGVGIPLAWGVFMTLKKAALLFK